MAADPEEKSDSNFQRESQSRLSNHHENETLTSPADVEEHHRDPESDLEKDSDSEDDSDDLEVAAGEEQHLEREQDFEEVEVEEYESDDDPPNQLSEIEVQSEVEVATDDDNSGQSQATPTTASSGFFSDCSDATSSDLDDDYARTFSPDEANNSKEADHQDFIGPFCPCCDRLLPGTHLDEWPLPLPCKRRRIE